LLNKTGLFENIRYLSVRPETLKITGGVLADEAMALLAK